MTENTPTPAEMSPLEQVLTNHVPREVYDGYPVEPDEEDVRPDYQETCMCGEPFPCAEVRLAEQFQAKEEAHDALAAILEQARDFAVMPATPDPYSAPIYLISEGAADALRSAPADALAARDADRWDEGAEAEHAHGKSAVNPYRIEREKKS